MSSRLMLIMGLAMLLSSTVWTQTTAQSSSSGSCTSTIISMAPCLNFVTGSSSSPSSQCCSQLSKVVQSSARCLCIILEGGASSLGVTVNRTLALALPNACNVNTPPVSDCNRVSDHHDPSSSPAAGSPLPSKKDTGNTGGSGHVVMNKLVSFLVIIVTWMIRCS